MLVVFDRDSFVLSGKIFSGVDSFIEENSVSEKLSAEYHIASAGSRAEREFLNRSHARRGRRKAAESVYSEDLEEEAVEFDGAAGFPDMSEMAAGSAPVLAATAMSDSLKERVAHLSDTWQESLLHMIDARELKDSDVYKRANVDRKLFSKIRKNAKYQPKKSTAVAFALALELDLDETKDFLGRAGYALSPSNVFDLIIEYFIEQKVYDSYTINLALFEHDQPLLGE